MSQHEPEPNGGQEHETSVTQALIDLNSNLAQSLKDLESLGPQLSNALHDEVNLPDSDTTMQVSKAVDTLHKIQLLLDQPVLVLADHFLGKYSAGCPQGFEASFTDRILAAGYVRSKCLLAAVERGVAEALAREPMTLEALAAATDSRSDRLLSILRILGSAGVFHLDDATGLYSNTPASTLLLRDHWTQWHNWAQLYGSQFYDIARGIPGAVRRDATRCASQINYDTDENMFSYFSRMGWVPELHRTLGGGAAAQMPGILKDYPWHEIADGLLIDVGGGGGGFLASLLRAFPTMRGGIYDLPHVIDHARLQFGPEGQYTDVGARVGEGNLIGGDFFKEVPPSEVYTMKWCLHDWKDAEAAAILKNIRKGLIVSPKSRLIVLESVISNAYSNRLSQYGDINMMMTTGGQERTEQQWHDLAAASDWRIEKVWDLRRAWVKALDFRPI